jgi:hypothetical protein
MAELPTPIRGANVVSLVHAQRSNIEQLNASALRPEQLALEFDKPHELLVVVTDQLHGTTFLRRLLQVRPKVIVDFRFAPHFNFTAVDSLIVKQQIEAVGARYVRYSIPFHEFGPSLLKHDPMAIATKLSTFARESVSSQWPIMVLLKEKNVARAFSPFLIGALSKDLGGKWTAEVVL